MTATAKMIELLRRMTAEPTKEEYNDANLAEYIEKYPLLDEFGAESNNSAWVPTYDLHAAAADIWEEKAASFIEDVDFSADGATFHLTRRTEQMMNRVRYHRARTTPKSARLYKWPEEKAALGWIGNLPESP